jgi:hypothetical protein
MIKQLDNQPTARWLAVGTAVAFAFNAFATKILDASYAKSRFPVPYYEAQLSFDASKLKGWYAYLADQGTLGTYLQTQNIDFVFIVSVLMLHVLALLLISRLFTEGSRLRRWMIVAALLSTLAPLLDAFENAVSYVMLANPTNFADGWALVYSSFAAGKFAMFTFAYAAAAVGILVGVILRGRSLLANRGSRQPSKA